MNPAPAKRQRKIAREQKADRARCPVCRVLWAIRNGQLQEHGAVLFGPRCKGSGITVAEARRKHTDGSIQSALRFEGKIDG